MTIVTKIWYHRAMDVSSYAAVVLSGLTAAVTLVSLVTGLLASSGRVENRALIAFLTVLCCTQAVGFLFYAATAQSDFASFMDRNHGVAVMVTVALLFFQYASFIASSFLVPACMGLTGRYVISCAAAVIGAIMFGCRVTGLLPYQAVLLAENALIMPLVYGSWVWAIAVEGRKHRLLAFLFGALIPAGLLERAGADPLWPLSPGARGTLSGIPFTMIVVLTFVVLLSVRNFRAVVSLRDGNRAEPDLARFRLSPREAEIASLLFKGHANKEIAQALDISYGTVKNYVHSLYAKLGIRTRFELRKFL